MWFGKVKAKQTMTVTNRYIDYLFYGCTAGTELEFLKNLWGLGTE
jgi:hypothetical protein